MDNKTFEERLYYSNKLLSRYPDRIPIIIEKDKDVILENYKYLLPKNINIGEFMSIIRTKMNIANKQAIFTFVKNCNNDFEKENYILVPMSESIENIYNMYKNKDKFLYIKFGIENTFG